jgi:hypothetical protein
MATTSVDRSEHAASRNKELISFEEAMEKLSREERFRATVYSMNTLLCKRGSTRRRNSSSSSDSLPRRTCASGHVWVA